MDVSDLLANTGSLSGDTLTIDGDSLVNEGTIGGGQVTLNIADLTNEGTLGGDNLVANTLKLINNGVMDSTTATLNVNQYTNNGEVDIGTLYLDITGANSSWTNNGDMNVSTLLASGEDDTQLDLKNGTLIASSAEFNFRGWDVVADDFRGDSIQVSDSLTVRANSFHNDGELKLSDRLVLDMESSLINDGTLSADNHVELSVSGENATFVNQGDLEGNTVITRASETAVVGIENGSIKATSTTLDFAGMDMTVGDTLTLENIETTNLTLLANSFTNDEDLTVDGDLTIGMKNTVLNRGTLAGGAGADGGTTTIRGSQVINIRPVARVERSLMETETVQRTVALGEGEYETRNVEMTHDYSNTVRQAGEGGNILGTDVIIEARDGDVINRGGNIAANNNLDVTAAGDVVNTVARTTEILTKADGCQGSGACGSLYESFEAGNMMGGGQTTVTAGGDILNQGSTIGGLQGVELDAGGDVINETLISTFKVTDIQKKGFFSRKHKVEHGAEFAVAQIVSGEGDVLINAENYYNKGGTVLTPGKFTGNIRNDIKLTNIAEEVENIDKQRGFSGFSYSSSKSKANQIIEQQSQMLVGE